MIYQIICLMCEAEYGKNDSRAAFSTTDSRALYCPRHDAAWQKAAPELRDIFPETTNRLPEPEE